MAQIIPDCSICKRPVTEDVKGHSGFIDDDEYGDVHEYCLENVDIVDDDEQEPK